jgi:hypothetical protein
MTSQLIITAMQLPTRSARKYRGNYPTRIFSWSGSKGTNHIELNDGRRYVVRGLRYEYPKTGLEFLNITGLDPDNVAQMSVADYAGVLYVIRITRALRTGSTDDLRRSAQGR